MSSLTVSLATSHRIHSVSRLVTRVLVCVSGKDTDVSDGSNTEMKNPIWLTSENRLYASHRTSFLSSTTSVRSTDVVTPNASSFSFYSISTNALNKRRTTTCYRILNVS